MILIGSFIDAHISGTYGCKPAPCSHFQALSVTLLRTWYIFYEHTLTASWVFIIHNNYCQRMEQQLGKVMEISAKTPKEGLTDSSMCSCFTRTDLHGDLGDETLDDHHRILNKKFYTGLDQKEHPLGLKR
ncbi:hypothetical protein NDU88_006500 [Pleurodeles waltl]|uniref:Uncharacterized protein n=1 Tax=Pleurodeles waltl TaxID=8319 RepID=A0AAV7SPM9_PLEWA|nr:hypothetical protein NDU88_006500 [Pleurodeles waltl]